MFGQMQVTHVFALSKRETVDEAVANLLQFADYPKIVRWFQFPTALVVFLAHPDALDCGAIYVYDRKRCVWLWVDFNDQNYGGYSPEEFDVLINQCHFLRLVESPKLLSPASRWHRRVPQPLAQRARGGDETSRGKTLIRRAGWHHRSQLI